MSKESKRPSRETRKPKTADKGAKSGPRYLAGSAAAKPLAPPPAKKR